MGHLLSSGITTVSPSRILYLSHDSWFNLSTAHGLHHGEMLQVVVCLEKCVTCKKFDQDATNAPYVAWIAPTQIQYNFRCSVVSCRNDRGMVFIIKSCRAKVDEPYLGVEEYPPLSGDTLLSCGGGRDISIIRECLV